MRLRLRRSQRSSGLLNNKVTFSLQARVDISAEEQDFVRKYNVGREIIYIRERVALADEADQATWKGLARNLAAYATALTIRIDDLLKGTVVECKDILEMLAVEEQIVTACQNFKAVLLSAAHFDGEEIVEL